MMIFIDTGAFLARYLSNDQYHQNAVALWQKLRIDSEKCITSNFVIDETLTLLGRRTNYGFASQRAKNLYTSQVLTILRPDKEDEIHALQYFEKYADQKVSFTDCVSMVLMKRQKINRIFSYDKHFELAGFHVIR